ncbi:hypothetical protein GC170_10995 [bacterium]|nr:hypothetical protein [bacterium]
MFSSLRKSAAIVPTVFALTLSFAGIGCGGGDTAPAPAAAGGETKPKAPPVKAKGGRMIESEENTPKRLQGRDN